MRSLALAAAALMLGACADGRGLGGWLDDVDARCLVYRAMVAGTVAADIDEVAAAEAFITAYCDALAPLDDGPAPLHHVPDGITTAPPDG